MGRITITLPEELREPLEALAADDGFATMDELVEALIEKRCRTRFAELIEEGLASPEAGEADEAYFRELMARAGGSA